MSALFIAGLVLILVFGYSVGAYVTLYKFNIASLLGKIASFVIIGAAVSLLTFTISLAIIWPPAM